jgi:hypothetical protein
MMNFAPSEISARTVVARLAGSRGVGRARISSRHVAETRKLSALNNSAVASSTAFAARPDALSAMVATDMLPCSFALPSSRSPGVIVFTAPRRPPPVWQDTSLGAGRPV